MATPPDFAQLKHGAENTLDLANKAIVDIADADTAGGLSGDTRREYHRLLQLIERARERVDSAATPQRAVYANKTAARALERALALRRTLGLTRDIVDPLEHHEDLCFYCARDDQPPYQPVEVAGMTMRVCAGCQQTIVPWETPTSEEMPTIRRSLKSVTSTTVRRSLLTFPLLAAILIAVIIAALFASHKGPFAAAAAPTRTPTPTSTPQPTATPTVASTDTPTPAPDTPTSTPRPKPTSAPTAQALFQSDWSKGTSGWASSGSGAWQISDGLLVYDGTDRSLFLSPTRTKGMPNFAVEATIRGQSLNDGYNAYGIAVHEPDPSNGDASSDGIKAGVGGQCCNASGNSALLWRDYLYPSYATVIGRADFDPSTKWHTYRLEVRGTNYTLYVDGASMVSGTSNRFLDNTEVGVFASRVEISVGSFKVVPLH